MADAKEIELKPDGKGEEGTAPAKERVPTKYESHTFPGFKPYPERVITDCLCILIFLVFFLGWIGMLVVGILYGKPEIITHSTDYEGNVCGFQLGTDNSWEKGTAPKMDITKAKKGVFPRLLDDFLRIPGVFDETSISDLTVTTMCAEECPVEGDIFCTYKFSKKMATKDADYANSPLTSSAKEKADAYLKLTATLSRAEAAKNPYLLELACGSDNECMEHFYNCDKMIVPTMSVMSRCVPNITSDKNLEQERCVLPLTKDDCKVNQTDDAYWRNCIEDDTGKMKQARFVCDFDAKKEKCKLSDEKRKRCRKIEDLKETTAVEIPQAAMTTTLLKKLQSFSKYVQDVHTAAGPVAVCGMVFSVVCGFVFLGVIGYIAGCFVWITILVTEICFIAIAILSLFRGGIISEGAIPDSVAKVNRGRVGLATNEEYEVYYKVAAAVFVFLSVLFLTIVIFLRKKIVEAIKVIKISARAVTDNYKIVFWPVISFIFIGGFTVLFILIGCLLMASAESFDVETQTNSSLQINGSSTTMDGAFLDVQSYKTLDTLKYLAAYDFFMWLWVCELIQAIAVFVIGGTVTKWYFTPSGQKREDLGNTSCCGRCQEGGISGAFCITMRKHFGTAAFGALVIAIIQALRACVAYLMHQMQQAPDNRLMKCLKCCVMCCLNCFEKCAKYLSKNAYIYTSIHGTSFCYSSYKSFMTIFNNLLRFGATGLSSALVILFGKLFVTFASTLACYLWLYQSKEYKEYTSEKYIDQKGTIFVCAVVAIMAYIVAQVFFNVYDIASDSIMLSYCLDIDEGGNAFKDKLGEDFELKKAPEEEHQDSLQPEENKKFCCGCK